MDLEVDVPHEATPSHHGLAQLKETSSLCGQVLGLGEVKKGCTENPARRARQRGSWSQRCTYGPDS